MNCLNKNTVYQADVLDFLARLDDNSIDLAIADPPYNMGKGEWDKFASEAEYFDFMHLWLIALLPKLKSTSSLYLFNNAYNSAMILSFLVNKGLVFKNWITWYKKDGMASSRKRYVNAQETILFYTKSKDFTFNCDKIRVPYISTERIKAAEKTGILKDGKRWYPNEKGKLCTDVWEITSERHKEKVNGKTPRLCHPTVKPHEMIERIINASSNEGDLVLDLFSGSGMTSITARDVGREYIGCEMDGTYIENIHSRGIEIGRL